MPLRIGSWWQANEEMDVVVVGQEAALLVECKWTHRPVGVGILRGLEGKAALIDPEVEGKRLFLGLCARSGFTLPVEKEAGSRNDLLLFDLPRIVAGA